MDRPFRESKPKSVLPNVRTAFFEELTASYTDAEMQTLLRNLAQSLARNLQWFKSWLDNLNNIIEDHADPDDARVKRNLKSIIDLIDDLMPDYSPAFAEYIQKPIPEFEIEHVRRLILPDTRDKKEKVPLAPNDYEPEPSLISFSLMYVSQHYHEVYYADTSSDTLPGSTIRFVEDSVFVPKIGGQWQGSVGQAIKQGFSRVDNSFTEREGVVACEDLAEGNISILMHSIYADGAEHSPDNVIAVAFCFAPLPNLFGSREREAFSKVVDSHAYGIRLWCKLMEASTNRACLQTLLQSHEHSTRDDSSSAMLEAIVTTETKHNAVGAILGIYFEAKEADYLLVDSAKISGSFLNRELSRKNDRNKNELLDSIERVSQPLARIKLGPWGSLLAQQLGSRHTQDLDLPDELTKFLWDFWQTFYKAIEKRETSQAKLESARGEQGKYDLEKKRTLAKTEAKIASDMFSALVVQMVEYLAKQSWADTAIEASSTQLKQIEENIQHILNFWQAYVTREENASIYSVSTSFSSRQFLATFKAWANSVTDRWRGDLFLLIGEIHSLETILQKDLSYPEPVSSTHPDPYQRIDSKDAMFWRSGIRAAKINDNFLHRILLQRLKANPLQLISRGVDVHHQLLSWVWDNPGNSLLSSIAKGLGLGPETYHTIEEIKVGKATKGYLLLLSLKPLVEDEGATIQKNTANSVVRFATTFQSAVLSEGLANLAAFARGASHGLKNALIIPELLLGKPRASSLSGAESGWPERCLPWVGGTNTGYLTPDGQGDIRTLIERAIRVRREVIHLKEQAQLFFWIMSPDRAASDAEKEMAKLHISMRRIIGETVLRGFLLTLSRLLGKEVRNIFPPGSNTKTELKRVQSIIFEYQALWEKKRDSSMDIPKLFEEISSLTALRWEIGNNWLPPNWELKGLDCTVVMAILLELFQNASKAAILSGLAAPRVRFSATNSSGLPGGESSITISNDASPQHIKILQRGWEIKSPDESSGGVRGLWQLSLLCERIVQQRLNLSLDRPADRYVVGQSPDDLPVQITLHFLER